MNPNTKLFFLDAKRVSLEEASEMAVAEGLNGEIFEGTLDVFHGIDPAVAAASICAAMRVISGAGVTADPYGYLIAEKLINAAVCVGHAYERTERGVDEVKHTGERIFSPTGTSAIVKSVTKPTGLLFALIERLASEIDNPHTRRFVASCCGPELASSIRYLRQDALRLAPGDLARPLTYIACVFDDLTVQKTLRQSLGTGRSSRTLERVKRNRLLALESPAPTNFDLDEIESLRRSSQDVADIIEKVSRRSAS